MDESTKKPVIAQLNVVRQACHVLGTFLVEAYAQGVNVCVISDDKHKPFNPTGVIQVATIRKG